LDIKRDLVAYFLMVAGAKEHRSKGSETIPSPWPLFSGGKRMSKEQRYLFFIFLWFVSGALAFALEAQQKSQGMPGNAHERHVRLEGQANFRDLGGYRTEDGRTVKWGLIYRSGQLSKLTDADIARIQELKIRTVVDLRGPSEIERGKDRLPEGVRDVSYPIDIAKLPRTDGSTAPASATPSENSMLQATQSIMLNRTDVYSALIRELAMPQNRPLVFHCTAGKDRAGVGAAIILSLLGVPWETVREDYLLSNIYRKEENERDLKNIRNEIAKKKGISPEQVDMTNYEPMYYVKPEYIDSALQEVISKYGSMEAFLRKGLGVSDELIQRLRSELLE
jgi:protein-tyrosine phosphatase